MRPQGSGRPPEHTSEQVAQRSDLRSRGCTVHAGYEIAGHRFLQGVRGLAESAWVSGVKRIGSPVRLSRARKEGAPGEEVQ